MQNDRKKLAEAKQLIYLKGCLVSCDGSGLPIPILSVATTPKLQVLMRV